MKQAESGKRKGGRGKTTAVPSPVSRLPSPAFRVVIPARLGSTRLPRKVLRDIAGKPLVQHVWESVRSSGALKTVIASDDDAVFQVCKKFGADVVMTSPTHQSGSDRVNEVAKARDWPGDSIVVNVQGDEPLMPDALVRQAAELLAQDREADLATLCHPIHSREEWLNPNVVKVVMDAKQRALYFSRAPIPWKREGTNIGAVLPKGLAYRHIGLYAWRVAALARFSAMAPEPLETCEALEQLRALAQGLHIKLGITDGALPRGVDTEEDLKVVAEIFSQRGR